jgi:predicted phage terminase large subunit-like protein
VKLKVSGNADGMMDLVTKSLRSRALRIQSHAQNKRGGLCEWGQKYFPEYFTNQPCKMHRQLGKTLAALHTQRGSRFLKIAPRGSAKSVYTTFLDPLYAICESLEKYILILSDTYGQAVKHLKGIRAELEQNEHLAEMYPEACGEGPEWSDVGICTRNGVRIEPLGTGQKVRGRRERADRPTLIIVDDPQGDEAAYSAVQREHDWEWLTRGVFKAGGPETNIYIAGTQIHRDCIVGRLSAAPGWLIEVDKSLDPFPDRMDLWGTWEQIYCNVGNPNSIKEAQEFYAQNRVEMERGAGVLWPEREPLVSLMMLRAEGKSSFESEKQNNPIDPEKCEWPGLLDGDAIWFDQWPKDCEVKTIGVDPKGKAAGRGDYAAVVQLAVKENVLYVDAILEKFDTTALVQKIIDAQLLFNAAAVGIESDQFQFLVGEEVLRQSRIRNVMMPMVPVPTKGIPKPIRIRRLGPYISMRAVRFKKNSPGAVTLLRQLQDFPNADHDDGPDGMDMALQVALQMHQGAELADELARDPHPGFVEMVCPPGWEN